MKTHDFWYDLPPELIAQTPLVRRDSSRMLVIAKETGSLLSEGEGPFSHRHFFDIADYLRPGDTLVLNNSRVLPARLIGQRAGGGAAELLLLRELEPDVWEALARPGRRMRPGDIVSFGEGQLQAEILNTLDEGLKKVRFHYTGIFLEVLAQLGEMPLPPYITERLEDPERYQTVYSKEHGSAAAPTAGLHFTPELLEKLRTQGVNLCEVTLHVGLGTFRPVSAENVEEHVMHSEVFHIPEDSRDIIEATHTKGGRVIAVGTTACRTLESAADEQGRLTRLSGSTQLFITPGCSFRVIDGMVTNFHLPESTLMMLISALAGRERVLEAYAEAVRERYRFFSFGDACLIL